MCVQWSVAGRLTTAGQGTVTRTSPVAACAGMASTGLGTSTPADDVSVSTGWIEKKKIERGRGRRC